MPKLFDYKFLITLGLSLVVYFLYREVENLNKRVSQLETKKIETNNNKKLIDLPPPPPSQLPKSQNEELSKLDKDNNQDNNQDNNNQKLVTKEVTQDNFNSSNSNNQVLVVPNNSNESTKKVEDEELVNGDETTVEEYSNEHIDHSIEHTHELYSHDNLNTDSHNIDSLMVDSILDMVKPDQTNEENVKEIKEAPVSNDVSGESNHVSEVSEQNKPSEQKNASEQKDASEASEQKNASEVKETNNHSDSIEELTMLPKINLESLLKMKVDELQEKANELGITITINGKKKKKADLANDIFEKLKN